MISGRVSDVTRLLEAAERGEAEAQEQLLKVIYAELHRMAEQKLARELPGHTLQPTALVHDAWLQLVGSDGKSGLNNRAHFFGRGGASHAANPDRSRSPEKGRKARRGSRAN
jgi:hypothetical protein